MVVAAAVGAVLAAAAVAYVVVRQQISFVFFNSLVSVYT